MQDCNASVIYGSSPMSPPQLPAYESLKSWVAFRHEGTSPRSARGQGFAERRWLTIVEHVAFSIVRSRASRRLISKLRTSLYRQRLVSVDEGFANR